MNNEIFCVDLISQISNELCLSSDDKNKLTDIIYKVTYFYIINKKEDEK